MGVSFFSLVSFFFDAAMCPERFLAGGRGACRALVDDFRGNGIFSPSGLTDCAAGSVFGCDEKEHCIYPIDPACFDHGLRDLPACVG